MNTQRDIKYKPHPEYRFWLYDSEGDGMVYYRTKEARDADAELAIEAYLDDGWAEEVEWVSAGEVTHFAQCLNKTMRPDVLDESECDDEGTQWPDGMEWRGTYKLESVTPNVKVRG